jgi:hypothetical protein
MDTSQTPPPNRPGRTPPNPPDRGNYPAQVRSEPPMDPPADVLLRHNARVLDPATALRIAGQAPIRPTVYIADSLLVSSSADQPARNALEQAAARFGLQLVGDDPSKAMRSQDVAARARMVAARMPIRVRLVPNSAEPTAAPDAWNVLQAYRAAQRGNNLAQQYVALDHLMAAARHTEGSPVHPSLAQQPISSYGQLGWGGRQPVNWVGHLPLRNPDVPNRRRPVVAVLDTGIGKHPWLPPGIVQLDPTVFDVTIVNPELDGITVDPYEAQLDPDAGHGTFIAGLIRQHCGDANVLAIRIMGGDGVVPESVLLDALWLLVLRQQAAIANGKLDELVDVVSLSLGYYHEQPDDVSFDPLLLEPLRQLGALGVPVVVAAGNDATNRPMFPAAFTPWPGGPITAVDTNCVPVTSVGALNPNGTIALFSNAGGWVATHRPGASLVSTFPTSFNAGEQPGVATPFGGEGMRATIDPDDFHSGFGVWSGTSFAAPVLAGQIAAQLCRVDLNPTDRESMLTRGWDALSACVEGLHR